MTAAIISPCGLYRYRLDRQVNMTGRGVVAWIMVNPSTADATQDDPTIRKVVGFSLRAGFERLIVGNVFAYRATDVRELAIARDPVGPENDDQLIDIIGEADQVVVAWGPLAKLPSNLRGHWHAVAAIAERLGKPLSCIGVAGDGHPRHPLMVAYATAIQPWSAP